MTAAEARNLTAKSLVVDIAPLLEGIHGRIKAAAEKGETKIVDPCSGCRGPISEAQRSSIYHRLRKDGYDVKMGVGDQREASVVTVSW